jgi:sulfonate transport system substrate-binding protein
MMAQTEIEAGSRLFFRDADANTYGVLNVREAFLEEHPDLVARVLAAYEKGRRWALANPEGLASTLATAAKLKPEVAARQLERTGLVDPRIGPAQRATIVAAGKALQAAEVIKASVDVEAEVDRCSTPASPASSRPGDSHDVVGAGRGAQAPSPQPSPVGDGKGGTSRIPHTLAPPRGRRPG